MRAPPHSLSQLATSFFACPSLGIPRAPLLRLIRFLHSFQNSDPPTYYYLLALVLASFYLDAPQYLNCQKTYLIRCMKYNSVSC
jgi:hypothetical protein